MTKLIKAVSGSSLLALSSVAAAHPGHDHGHWLSDPIHALTALAIGAVVTAAVVGYKKVTAKK